MKRVFTYYEPMPDRLRYNPHTEGALIEFWKQSWEKAGWSPVVLNESVARRHPRFEYHRERFLKCPSPWRSWQLAGLTRWVAMSVVGGGMLADYDVINYGFRPEQVKTKKRIQIFCDDPPGFFMGAVFGTQEQYQDMVVRLSGFQMSAKTGIMGEGECKGQRHVGDLARLLDMRKNLIVPWTLVPGCALYGFPSCKTAPMVHYHNVHRFKNGDSVSWIETIRPI